MLPPVPPHVFEQNPKFKVLYNDLKTGRINEDGSSKLIKKQRGQDELRKAKQRLQTARFELAKTALLCDALASVANQSSGLPDEIRQVVLVICYQLAGHLTADDREVVVEDFEYFVEHLEQVSEAVSVSISDSARHVTAVAEALDFSPSTASQASTQSLPGKAIALRNSIVAQSASLSSRTLQLADAAVGSAASNRELLQAAVRVLEQYMHGTAARASHAKAEHLATVARGMELKLAIISHDANPSNPLSSAGDERLAEAMQSYFTHLRRAREELASELSGLEARLSDYDSGGPGMRDIAKKYGQLLVERTEAQEEIARLQAAA